MNESNTHAALRATLNALAPQLRLDVGALPLIADRLMNAGVGVDSTGAVAMTCKAYAGRDISDFLVEVVAKTEPSFFTHPPITSPAQSRDVKAMTATQKLGFANGDKEPRL